jgi:hypothetical protein
VHVRRPHCCWPPGTTGAPKGLDNRPNHLLNLCCLYRKRLLPACRLAMDKLATWYLGSNLMNRLAVSRALGSARPVGSKQEPQQPSRSLTHLCTQPQPQPSATAEHSHSPQPVLCLWRVQRAAKQQPATALHPSIVSLEHCIHVCGAAWAGA